MFRRESMGTLSFRRQRSPSLRVFQNILNISFSLITSRHTCLSIPLFLDIFQILRQTFPYFWFCFVFLYDNWSKYFDWLKKQSLYDISNLNKFSWYFSPLIDRYRLKSNSYMPRENTKTITKYTSWECFKQTLNLLWEQNKEKFKFQRFFAECKARISRPKFGKFL